MIIVGKRQSGKTTYAIDEVVRRCKDGDIIGVLSYDYDSANHLDKLLRAKIKDKAKRCVTTKFIFSLEDIKDVDHVLIDNLDLVLGDKCVCATTNGVVNVISDTYVDSETSYKEVYNQKNTSKEVERLETEKPMSIIECRKELMKKLDIDLINDDYDLLINKTNKLIEFIGAVQQLAEAHKNFEATIER